MKRSDNIKIIYLGAYKAYHPNYDIIYQDINGKRDISGDMLEVDLTPYDIIIATPPCNYWSRARGNNKPSEYAENTKHLLPDIIDKLIKLDKPFIVENVRNNKKFKEHGLMNKNCWVYEHGRHTYWTNRPFNPKGIKQIFDFSSNGKRLHDNTQGGKNVHDIIEYWLSIIK